MKQLINFSIITLITLILFIGGTIVLLETELIHFQYYSDLKRHLDFESAKEREIKVLILGDSQLEDWPFDHCLHKEMKSYFGDLDIGYCNASHFGFGPIEYLHEVERLMPIYKPNHIILYFYAGNDMSDVIYRMDVDPRVRTHDFVNPPEFKLGLFTPQENEVDTIRKKGVNTFDWEGMQEKGIDSTLIDYAKNGPIEGEEFEGKTVNPHLLQTGLWKPDFLYDNVSIRKVESQYGWYKTLKYLDKIVEKADSINSTLSIVVIPTNVQVDTLNYNFYRKALFNIDVDLLEINDAQTILRDYCEERHLPYIDLLPAFKEDCKTEHLYLVNDNHLSENGHMSAFKIVKSELLDRLEYEKKNEGFFLGPLERTDFTYSQIPWQIECIKKDSLWFSSIVEKAAINKISVDSQLFLDAEYVVKLKKEKSVLD